MPYLVFALVATIAGWVITREEFKTIDKVEK